MSLPAGCDIQTDMGPGFIGFMVCLSLYGVTLAQTNIYFRRFPADAKLSKILISSLCVVDTLHVFLLSNLFWSALIFGRSTGSSTVNPMPWQLPASLVVSFIVTFVVQGFFCMRIQRLGPKNWVATGVIAAAALAQLVSGMVFAVNSIVDQTPAAVFGAVSDWSFKIELIASLLCDVLISGSLIHYFHINKGLSKRTETILQKCISLAIRQGVLLGLVTIITLVLVYNQAATFLAMPSQFILSKLYVNCLLATLNRRKEFRKIAFQDTNLSLAVSTDENVDEKTNVPSD